MSIALIAGQGNLAAELIEASADRPFVAAIEGFLPAGVAPDLVFRIERLIPFFARLHEAGITRICFAGALHRPRLDPALFDPETARIVPRMIAAMGQGDDATLREVMLMFEEEGFCIIGAAELAPLLLAPAGCLTGEMTKRDRQDAERAAMIAEALGRVDVGQGCVVQQGLCLAVETLAGTDAMLASVAALPEGLRPDPARGRGLLYKAPKPGQDLRIDMPAIGMDTLRNAAAAGLGGIVWQADGVLCLDREAMVRQAADSGLFLWAREQCASS